MKPFGTEIQKLHDKYLADVAAVQEKCQHENITGWMKEINSVRQLRVCLACGKEIDVLHRCSGCSGMFKPADMHNIGGRYCVGCYPFAFSRAEVVRRRFGTWDSTIGEYGAYQKVFCHCGEEATFAEHKMCDNHWTEWWVGNLNLNEQDRKTAYDKTLKEIKQGRNE